MSDPPQFIVRTWSVNSQIEPEDAPAGPYLDVAVQHAWHLAGQKHIRSAAVMDDRSMVWAQFNLTWMVPEGYRGDL